MRHPFNDRGLDLIRRVCALALVLLAGCYKVYINPLAPQEVSIPADQQIVPLKFDGGQYFVQVMVNGSGPYPFLLDTGATSSAISSGLAKELNLQAMPSGQPSETPFDHVSNYSVTKLSSLKVGQAEFRNVAVKLASDEGLPPAARGVVGFSLLWDGVWTFDGPQSRIVLNDTPVAHPGSDKSRQPIAMHYVKFSLPQITMTIIPADQKKLLKREAVLDTGHGAWPGILLPPSWLVGPSAGSLKASTTVLGATGPGSVQAYPIDDKFTIGWAEFVPRVVGSAPKLADHALIGASVLKDCVITFDSRNARLWMWRPPQSPPPATAPQRRQ